MASIQVVEPEGILQRIERPSSQASKIEALQRELDTLRNQFAKLEFGFWEEGKITKKVVRPVSTPKLGWPSNAEITKVVGEKKQQLEETVNRANRTGVKKTDIENFTAEYRDYTEKLEMALKWQRSREFGTSCDLAFTMRSSGSVPAADIEVDLIFPINSFVVGTSERNSDFLDEVWIPDEPKPDWEKVTGSLSSYMIPPSPHKEPTPRGPLYDLDNRHIVTYEHPKLRHKNDWLMSGVRVYLDPTTKGGFQIKYSVVADNMVDPINGHLNVVLTTG